MPGQSMRLVCVSAVCGLLLAACSARSNVAPAGSITGRAAQRIELDGAGISAPSADLVVGEAAGRRTQAPVAEEVKLPDGTVGVKVAQQYFHTIVVCRQRDGSFSTQCPAAPESRQ